MLFDAMTRTIRRFELIPGDILVDEDYGNTLVKITVRNGHTIRGIRADGTRFVNSGHMSDEIKILDFTPADLEVTGAAG